MAIHSRIFSFAFLVWALFIPLALTIPRDDLFSLINGLALVASISVLIAYWPAVRLVVFMRPDEIDYVDFLTLGIMCAWASTLGRVLILIYVQQFAMAPVPKEFVGYTIAFIQYLNWTGAILHLSARRVIKNEVPKSSTPRVVISIGLGIIVGLCLMTINRPFDGEGRNYEVLPGAQ